MLEELRNWIREMLTLTEERIAERIQGMLEDQRKRIMKDVERMIEGRFKGEGNKDGRDNLNARNTNEEEESSSQYLTRKVDSMMEAIAYGEFHESQPPIFDGTPHPEVVMEWTSGMEKAFSGHRCKEELKVKFAVTRLRSKALEWWKTLEEAGSADIVERITWDDLVEAIKEEFCTPQERQQMEENFLSLTKRGMSVARYNSTFLKFMSIAKGMRLTDERKVHQYIEGLPYEYRMSIGEPETLGQAMEKAGIIEKKFEDRDKEADSNANSFRKRSRVTRCENKENNKKKKLMKACKDTNKQTQVKKNWTCFKCGEEGHYADQCSNGFRCFNCQCFGHVSTRCPDKKEERKDKSSAGPLMAAKRGAK